MNRRALAKHQGKLLAAADHCRSGPNPTLGATPDCQALRARTDGSSRPLSTKTHRLDLEQIRSSNTYSVHLPAAGAVQLSLTTLHCRNTIEKRCDPMRHQTYLV